MGLVLIGGKVRRSPSRVMWWLEIVSHVPMPLVWIVAVMVVVSCFV